MSPVKYELGFYIPEGGILHIEWDLPEDGDKTQSPKRLVLDTTQDDREHPEF
jgi:hypothetical protein